MASSFKAGYRQLGQFKTTLKRTDQLLLMTSRELAKEGLRLIDEGFEKRQDPLGHKWKRRKKRYPWPILNKTLALRRGWKTESNQHAFKFINPTFYTVFHQKGTRKMVARKMVPDRSLSPKWRARMHKVWLKQARKHYFG